MKRLSFAVVGFAYCVFPAFAQSPEMPSEFAKCQTLQACIHALDAIAPSRQDSAGSPSLDSQFAKRLETFGEPAKREVLKRAAGNDKGWRGLANRLFEYWQSFDERDVPALILALHAAPGEGAALPLGRIGTPEAIKALAEDARLHGAENQSGWALSQLGDRVFPYLMPMLSDDKHWDDAALILRRMKSKAADGLDAWLAVVLDPTKPERDRVGALRGIGILGTSAKQVAAKIRPLLAMDNGYGPIPETAKKALEAMGDITMASEVILACVPSRDPYEESFDSTECLERAAAYGSAEVPYANPILNAFTYSRTGVDRANGASILGYIGYREATQRLIELLGDADWRVVYAATRSLGWMGEKEAIPELTLVAKAHWLGDVRTEAEKVMLALRSPAGAESRPAPGEGTLGFPPKVDLEVRAANAPDIAPCPSNTWAWNGTEFHRSENVRTTLQIGASGNVPAGALVGEDRGEWGGQVTWNATAQVPHFVAYGNFGGIEPSRNGAVVVIGSCCLAAFNSDYALELKRDASGAWRATEIARFPSAAYGLKSIGRDLFAVWSGNRAVVFAPAGISGVAQCVATQ
jgi:HEAT repeat protein